MARITPEEIKQIATLARLSLTPDEVARLCHDLDAMLDYVGLLAELDTRDVEPTAQVVPVASALRADRSEASLDVTLALANAPASEGAAFLVPKVIEEEG